MGVLEKGRLEKERQITEEGERVERRERKGKKARDMEEDDHEGGAFGGDDQLVVVPGEEITRGNGFLRGHGTFVAALDGPEEGDGDDDDMQVIEEEGDGDGERVKLIASVAGVVTRINRLISVRPVQSRYNGEVGDVVIGRIVEVGNKQWKVDLGSRQPGKLMLGSINLPGGALRRRTLEDQLQMRSLFTENDLVSAEVSSFQHGGSGVAIHTRSMRYGKLENGVLVQVPSSLIKRLNQHFCTLPCGVDAIFGLNGRIWLTATREKGQDDVDKVAQSRMTDEMEAENKRHADRVLSPAIRLAISRVRNSVLVLVESNKVLSPQSVTEVFDRSVKLGLSPAAMLVPEASDLIFGSD